GGRASAALARTPADAEVVARVGLPVDPRGIALCHEEDRRATVAAPSRSAPAAIAPLSALAACAAPPAGSAGTAGTAVPAGTAFRALSAVSAVAADEAATLEPHRKKREPLFRVGGRGEDRERGAALLAAFAPRTGAAACAAVVPPRCDPDWNSIIHEPVRPARRRI